MRFCISYGNHGHGGVHVEDIMVYIRNALLAAGEDAYISPGLLTDGVNILLECFTDEQARQIVQLRRNSGARFVIVATEFTDGKRFNPHITSGKGHYVDTQYWQKRFELFMDVAAESDAIWCLSEYALLEYRPLFPDKPVSSFPIGFDPLFPAYAPPLTDRKDFDLLFTGSLTPHREMLVTALRARFSIMALPATTLTVSRVDLIRRSKASLHLNLQENAMYSSILRHHFLVMCGAAVVSERAQTVGALDEFITQFDGSEFVDRVADFLSSGEWKWRGAAMHEQYRKTKPIGDAVRQMLKAIWGTQITT